MLKTRAAILPANAILLVIGLADLVSTMFWLHTGQVIEANPVMATLLSASLPLFVLTKLGTLLAYVGVMEWYRRHKNPQFAQIVASITVTAYVGIYAVSFCMVNHGYFLG
ncbi:MAG: DUF5658 family protein [Armatimonadota bacterium]|nr:DUF5658 family protein [bacterium]